MDGSGFKGWRYKMKKIEKTKPKKPQLGQRLLSLVYSRGAVGAAVVTTLAIIAERRPKIPQSAGD